MWLAKAPMLHDWKTGHAREDSRPDVEFSDKVPWRYFLVAEEGGDSRRQSNEADCRVNDAECCQAGHRFLLSAERGCAPLGAGSAAAGSQLSQRTAPGCAPPIATAAAGLRHSRAPLRSVPPVRLSEFVFIGFLGLNLLPDSQSAVASGNHERLPGDPG